MSRCSGLLIFSRTRLHERETCVIVSSGRRDGSFNLILISLLVSRLPSSRALFRGPALYFSTTRGVDDSNHVRL